MTAYVRRAPERDTRGRDTRGRDTEGRDMEPAAGRQAVLGGAQVHITVELGYPSDIGAQCAAVRREVTERLRTWAGMEVSDLVVSVERLHSVHARHSGLERVR
ncbi:hypothetical protein [Streptomyces sp. MNU76]|uniref:hypothetical protein n=1 Tax=Streptomyces sp. MNU76 TaxID=2560026 RepID=UPI0027E18FA2|nr:hypothetical protein [Streptomyces sp. MNU76]